MKRIKTEEQPVQSSRLATSLLIVMAAIFCVSAIVVFSISTLKTRANTQQTKQIYFEQTVNHYTSEITNWMEMHIEQMRLLQHQLQSMSPEHLTSENIMPIVVNSTEYGQSLGVISDYVVLDQERVFSGDGWVPEAGYDVTQNDYYTQPQTSSLYISQPYADAAGNGFVVTLALPITIDGTFQGVLARDVNMSSINDMFEAYDRSDGSYMYLLDATGTILSHGNADYETTKDRLVTLEQVGDNTMQDAVGKMLLREDYDQQKRYFYAMEEPDSHWIVGVAYPEKVVQQEIVQQVLGSFIVFFLAVLVGLVILTVIMKRKFAPIHAVTQAAQKLERGEFDIEFQNSSRDELGVLQNSFEDTGTYLRSVIQELAYILQELSKGNLTVKTTLDYRGEFVEIEQAVHNIIKQMNYVMGNIERAGYQVSSEAAQVSTSAQYLSENSMTQAIQVESIVKDMQQVKNAVEENTGRTVTTESVTTEVSKQLEESKARMKQMMQEMEKIKSASNQIGNIIKTIEDISFQTNILALNAAVEAARAGAAGKGFAVVADEVRALANKSAMAAQDTTALIQTSIDTVERGAEVAQLTEQALLNAVELSNQVSQETQIIVEISQQQSANIDNITQTVSGFSNMIQTNTATAEENAAVSERMANEAKILQELLSKFVLDKRELQDEQDVEDL